MRFVPPAVVLTCSVFAALCAGTPLAAQSSVVPLPPAYAVSQASDSATAIATAIATVERFRAALSRGDSAAALDLLAPDVVVLESGGVETRAEYRSHHLAADIQYARAIPGSHTLAHAAVHGDAAWVSSTSVTKGQVKGRAIDSVGAELIVLSRRDAQSPWHIRAIHWSSRKKSR